MEAEEQAGGMPPIPAAEARLVEQLRQGDAEAGRQLVRDYYPGVYRYLLYLTRRPDGVLPRFQSRGGARGRRPHALLVPAGQVPYGEPTE